MAGEDGRQWLGSGRYGYGTPAFARVANLSDAVFAIAMTLLVLTLDTPATNDLTGALVDQLPQLSAFLLGFALVANLWWQHHKLFELLGSLEGGLIGINLVLLGAVALVPFPTSLVGNAPTDRAAVLPFIGLSSPSRPCSCCWSCTPNARVRGASRRPSGCFSGCSAGGEWASS
jgi:hypothetical protein